MKRILALGAFLLLLFAGFTVLIAKVDVAPIGCGSTDVGFSSLNAEANQLFGQHETIYKITEALGCATWGVVALFGLLGLSQLISRRSLLKVDRDILALGGGYAVMLACYVLFEKLAINYRPVFSAFTEPEPSYPSSHTLMLVFVMATAMMQIAHRVKSTGLRRILMLLCLLTALAVVCGRLVCGVHWLTDIVGALILAEALAVLYYGVAFAADSER